jgi:hypothetical protein
LIHNLKYSPLAYKLGGNGKINPDIFWIRSNTEVISSYKIEKIEKSPFLVGGGKSFPA